MNTPNYNEIKTAIDVLNKASDLYLEGTPGATDDPRNVMIEAARNLTSLVKVLYGSEEWMRIQEET